MKIPGRREGDRGMSEVIMAENFQKLITGTNHRHKPQTTNAPEIFT